MRQARESRDRPILNAFWRVAPSVRFRDRAMLDAFVFFRAAAFKVRTSAVVHARRFDFLAIQTSPLVEKKGHACSRDPRRRKRKSHWRRLVLEHKTSDASPFDTAPNRRAPFAGLLSILAASPPSPGQDTCQDRLGVAETITLVVVQPCLGAQRLRYRQSQFLGASAHSASPRRLCRLSPLCRTAPLRLSCGRPPSLEANSCPMVGNIGSRPAAVASKNVLAVKAGGAWGDDIGGTTRTGIVSCSTSLTFFIASARWHRWALGCHSSSPGVLSGTGF